MWSCQHPRIRVHREAGPLGSWRLALCTPAADLADVVEQIWFGEGEVSYERDRILPTGSSHLLINLGPAQILHAAEGPRRFEQIWFSGSQQAPLDTSAPFGQALLGVAFNPLGARAWLGIPAWRLSHQVNELDALIGVGARQLRERLLNEPNIGRRLLQVEAWLRQRRALQRAQPSAVQWAVQRLEASRGQLPIDDLARSLGYSRKYLARLFLDHVGLSAKALARLHRFNDALAMLRQVERVPWVELAARCGYYDQSHLIRDFHEFSGFAPGEFVRLARPDSVSVVIR